MKYYQIYDDYFLDYGITAEPTLPDGSIFAGSQVDESDLPELIYEINVPDDEKAPHFMTGSGLIVSDLFIKTLQQCSVDNFQSFPVVVINPETQKKRSGYHLFNVLGVLKAAYSEHSSDKNVDEPLEVFNELTLDRQKINGERMFRLFEDPTILIIDESLKIVIKNNRPEEGWGVIFEEVNVI